MGEALAVSVPLRKLVEMRDELAVTWGRSNATADQLLAHLQDWCKRAEESGIAALQDLSLRMRSYKAG
jgi:stearoyl-CoA desaturase (delta-9 desaturase)